MINVFLLSFYCLFCSSLVSTQVSCWPLRKNFVIDTRCTAPFTHYYWLSRPTGFWLSKKEKESVILLDINMKKLSTTKCCVEKNLKIHINFYLSNQTSDLPCCPLCLTMKCSKLMSAHFACQNVWLPTEGGQKAWSKLDKFEVNWKLRKNGKVHVNQMEKCT